MCLGDLHNIDAEVRKFDPHYFLCLNPVIGKYQVMERRSRKMPEGELDGVPLFSFRDVNEVVMTIDFIDAEKEAPDMRIIHELRQRDVWRHPGGAIGFYDDLMRESERTKQKRDEEFADKVRYQAEERHKYVVREYEGLDTKTLF